MIVVVLYYYGATFAHSFIASPQDSSARIAIMRLSRTFKNGMIAFLRTRSFLQAGGKYMMHMRNGDMKWRSDISQLFYDIASQQIIIAAGAIKRLVRQRCSNDGRIGQAYDLLHCCTWPELHLPLLRPDLFVAFIVIKYKIVFNSG
jgi:hypothetical protein